MTNEMEIETAANTQDEEIAPSTVEGGAPEALRSRLDHKITRTKRWEKSQVQSRKVKDRNLAMRRVNKSNF